MELEFLELELHGKLEFGDYFYNILVSCLAYKTIQ